VAIFVDEGAGTVLSSWIIVLSLVIGTILIIVWAKNRRAFKEFESSTKNHPQSSSWTEIERRYRENEVIASAGMAFFFFVIAFGLLISSKTPFTLFPISSEVQALFGFILLMFVVNIPSIWLVLMRRFTRPVATLTGLLVIISFFPLLADKSIPLCKAVAIIGLWLTGAGVVGKKRLERWETKVNTFVQGKKEVELAEAVGKKSRRIVIPVLRTTLIVTTCVAIAYTLALALGSSVFGSVLLSVGNIIVVAWLVSALAFLVLGYFTVFIGYLTLIPLSIALLPYHITFFIENESVLERSMIFTGCALGTIGILCS
jgi:hypothetical protein